jgi:PIN domain nuclease of toxin-antitoxin system
VSPLLLDTHAALWLDNGSPMRPEAVAAIDAAAAAARGGGVLVSAVTAWEIGLLVEKRRIALDLAPPAWLERLVAVPGVRTVPLTASAALASCFLPGPFHGDPADRMLVATARELGAALVTRDGRILAYAAAGGVRALAC